MILIGETIFDDFARMAKYDFEEFLEKVTAYAENAIGTPVGSNHPFWDDLERWIEDNRDVFDEEVDKAA